jgi:hypothetical protein
MTAPFSGRCACGSIRYVCARASRDAQLPLPGLPTLERRTFRFRRLGPGSGHRDGSGVRARLVDPFRILDRNSSFPRRRRRG